MSNSLWPQAARQASLSLTISQSLPKFMSIESVMLSNHLILCHSLLLLPSIFPSIKVFSSESALHIRSPKYWCFSFQSLNSLFIMYGHQFHLPHWLFQLHLLSWGCDYSPQIGLSWFLRWQRICPQCERPKFDPWVGKIPWRREWLPTPVYRLGEFHGLYSPWGRKESHTIEWLSLLSRANCMDNTNILT